MVEPIKKVLMDRDGLSDKEAQEQVDSLKQECMRIATEGGSLMELEDLLIDEVGLEPDYLDELLFSMF